MWDEHPQETKNETRLIVAASDHDPDMLYATKFFVPDPFIFPRAKRQRTIVLSDLEIDRARREAQSGRDRFLQPDRA